MSGDLYRGPQYWGGVPVVPNHYVELGRSGFFHFVEGRSVVACGDTWARYGWRLASRMDRAPCLADAVRVDVASLARIALEDVSTIELPMWRLLMVRAGDRAEFEGPHYVVIAGMSFLPIFLQGKPTEHGHWLIELVRQRWNLLLEGERKAFLRCPPREESRGYRPSGPGSMRISHLKRSMMITDLYGSDPARFHRALLGDRILCLPDLVHLQGAWKNG
jgi:hypothetical protein